MNVKHILSTLSMLIVIASLLLAACAPAVPAKPAKEMLEPVTVVKSFYEAYNANDIEKAMSLTAEDYVMNDPTGTYDHAVAATQWQAVRDSGITFNQTNFVDTGNGRVTSCYEVLSNGASVDKGCDNVTHVRDGRIIYDGLENAEQIWVVQKYYEALNTKKLELAMSFIAGEAVFINPTGTYEGTDAIRKSLAGLNTDGITFDLSNFRNTEGRIVYDYKVVQGANLLDQGTDGLTVVKNGLIVFDGTERTEHPSDPTTIAQNFYQAINDGDIEAAMAVVAEDVKCRGECYFSGKDLFRSYILSATNRGDRIDISDLKVEEDKVSYNWKAYSKDGFFQAAGVETLQIKDGLIVLIESVAQ
jgi:ketosteroid isomerase-like protein